MLEPCAKTSERTLSKEVGHTHVTFASGFLPLVPQHIFIEHPLCTSFTLCQALGGGRGSAQHGTGITVVPWSSESSGRGGYQIRPPRAHLGLGTMEPFMEEKSKVLREKGTDPFLGRFLKGREITCGLNDKQEWARCTVGDNSFSERGQNLSGLLCRKHAGSIRRMLGHWCSRRAVGRWQ